VILVAVKRGKITQSKATHSMSIFPAAAPAVAAVHVVVLVVSPEARLDALAARGRKRP